MREVKRLVAGIGKKKAQGASDAAEKPSLSS